MLRPGCPPGQRSHGPRAIAGVARLRDPAPRPFPRTASGQGIALVFPGLARRFDPFGARVRLLYFLVSGKGKLGVANGVDADHRLFRALLDRVLRAAPSRGDPAGVDRLGAAWRRAPGPDRAPPSTPATCARPARRYWGTLAVLYETGSRECLRRSSLRGRAQRPLARQGASCAGGVP